MLSTPLTLPLRIDSAGILPPKLVNIEDSCGSSPTTAGVKEITLGR